jgi:hypothetical protein
MRVASARHYLVSLIFVSRLSESVQRGKGIGFLSAHMGRKTQVGGGLDAGAFLFSNFTGMANRLMPYPPPTSKGAKM